MNNRNVYDAQIANGEAMFGNSIYANYMLYIIYRIIRILFILNLEVYIIFSIVSTITMPCECLIDQREGER